jgi:hypothetical protein
MSIEEQIEPLVSAATVDRIGEISPVRNVPQSVLQDIAIYASEPETSVACFFGRSGGLFVVETIGIDELPTPLGWKKRPRIKTTCVSNNLVDLVCAAVGDDNIVLTGSKSVVFSTDTDRIGQVFSIAKSELEPVRGIEGFRIEHEKQWSPLSIDYVRAAATRAWGTTWALVCGGLAVVNSRISFDATSQCESFDTANPDMRMEIPPDDLSPRLSLCLDIAWVCICCWRHNKKHF